MSDENEKRCEVVVLNKYCKGCGLCVDVCAKGKLYMSARPDQHGVQPAAVKQEGVCTGCLKCATICPDAAIEIYRVVEAVVGRGSEQ